MADEHSGENTAQLLKTNDQIIDEWLVNQRLTRDDVDIFRAVKEAVDNGFRIKAWAIFSRHFNPRGHS